MVLNPIRHLEEDIQNITHAELLYQNVWKQWVELLSEIYGAGYDGARSYFKEQNILEIFPTILGGALGACENFQTVYDFGEKYPERFLTQTAQIQLEICLRVNPKVSCITRSFRREANIHDGRHLREFTLIELEASDCNLDQLLTHAEHLVHSIVSRIVSAKQKRIESFLGIHIEEKAKPYLAGPFPRITYTEAVNILQKKGLSVSWGDDFRATDEKELLDYAGNKPFFLTHFPTAIKFFNMKQSAQNADIVNSADLILPRSGEAIGGAEREMKFDVMWERFQKSSTYALMTKRGLTKEDFGCYFTITKKLETSSHAGFGLGFERLLQSLFSQEATDIRVFTLPFILTTWLVDRKKI